MTITCRVHGDFRQIPNSHLRGRGCPKCGIDNHPYHENSAYGLKGFYGTESPSFLYVLIINSTFIKIGLSKDTDFRISQIKRQSGIEDIILHHKIRGKANSLFTLEQYILNKESLVSYLPEVEFNGKSECLELSELPKVMEILKKFEEESVE